VYDDSLFVEHYERVRDLLTTWCVKRRVPERVVEEAVAAGMLSAFIASRKYERARYPDYTGFLINRGCYGIKDFLRSRRGRGGNRDQNEPLEDAYDLEMRMPLSSLMLIEVTPDPRADPDVHLSWMDVCRVLERLDERERTILHCPTRVVEERLGVCNSRVSQLRSKLLARLESELSV
jgi:hypothetical protein